MDRASFVIFRIAAGLAVGLWGLSKLFFVQSWVVPYESAFYAELPGNGSLWVYLLAVIQVLIALGIIFNIYRKPAAWIAVIFSVVNLVVSTGTFFEPENPILSNPAPIGIKLVWFFFNPLAITLLLIGVGLMPKSKLREAKIEVESAH